ncbi:TRAP transporter small permease [Cohaesibacter celericrescens]|uniref:TRAP transporter small permease protein n=1 Tax=Cohaesibacter celericrescens TaxID=2067669 RepID=A0A2N5XV10_9HYPH|nr:TRAP transporter small permease subunit [Cohaesibacter celericrescens]PLW78258.1 C4-dicarboxylate ABC transporter permease [Cohaesibacter celericrescens]
MTFMRRIFTVLLGLPLAYLVLATSYSVFMRYWMEAPVHWMEETSGLAMIWVVMIGAMCAERDGDNLSIAVLIEMMNKKMQRVFIILVSLVSIGMLLYLAYLGNNLANRVAFKLTGVLKLSWYWIDIAVPVGMIGSAIFIAIRLVSYLRTGELDEHKEEGGAA